METAKETDLPDLLEHLGYTIRRLGSRYHTTREMDSLRIKDRRTWKRYSNGKGGDAITFLQEFCGKDFRAAVNYLLEFNGGRARDSPIPHCAVNMTECAGKEPEPMPEPVTKPEPEPEPGRTGGIGSVLAVLLLAALVGGSAVCYLKFFKKKPDTRGSADLDDYDYGEAEEDEVMESDSEERAED